MLSERAEPAKRRVWASPSGKLRVDDLDEFGERWEVSVVKPKSAEQLPDAFDRIELGAVGRQEKQDEVWSLGLAPFQVQLGVMIFRIVDDDHHLATAAASDSPEFAQEAPTGFRVKAALRLGGDQLAVADPYGAKVTDAFACRRMMTDRVADLGRNPHSAAASCNTVQLRIDALWSFLR